MFARTERLLLRPGFPEDAPALAMARLDETPAMAEAFLAQPRDPLLPSLLITERTGDAPRIVGGCRLGRRASGSIEIDLWVARQHRGRGIATEAGAALIDIARTLRLPTVEASHFLDDPASGRVLEKLGFVPTGIVAARTNEFRGYAGAARLMRLCLCRERQLEPLAA